MIEQFHILGQVLESYATPQNIAVWTLVSGVLGSVASAILIFQWIAKWQLWSFIWKYFLLAKTGLVNFWKHLAFEIFLVSRFPAYSLHLIKNQIKMATQKNVAAKLATKKARKKSVPNINAKKK